MSDTFGKTLKFGQTFGKVMVYHVETGKAVERWPVDARGMVACGEYTYDPSAEMAGGDKVAVNEPEPQDAPETPRKHPLSTEDAPVSLKVGEASAAKPIKEPSAAKKTPPKAKKRKSSGNK